MMTLIGRSGLALLGLIGLAGTARADMIASDLLFHPNQTLAVCTIFNFGDAVTIKQARILRESGQNRALSINSCENTLAANNSCEMIASIPSGGGHVCKMLVNESAANLRGHFELRQGNYGYLLHTTLR